MSTDLFTKNFNRLFTEMPSHHYMEESQILLSMANDDISDADNIRIAVKVGRWE